jgi:Starch-binding associating with outer membrane
LNLIATQKWIHFNVVQPVDLWAEIRRLDLPKLTFRDDPANTQKQPPVRWFYPTSESIYNPTNYSSVSGKDNLATKVFWDVK